MMLSFTQYPTGTGSQSFMAHCIGFLLHPFFIDVVFTGTAAVGIGVQKGAQENDRSRLHPSAGEVLLESAEGKRSINIMKLRKILQINACTMKCSRCMCVCDRSLLRVYGRIFI